MQELMLLECTPNNTKECVEKLSQAMDSGAWVQLLPTKGERISIPNDLLPKGPGVVISGGGSVGEKHQCLLSYESLDKSTIATEQWLTEQGLKPNKCSIFNPLPLHHVSGLMPWWRSRLWRSKHNWLSPSLMRNPVELEQVWKRSFQQTKNPTLLSLVPTQLQRLLSHPAGIRWLKSFAVIWVGGSNLSEHLAKQARALGIRLAPCYGATETAAMVTVLSPDDFLAGRGGCGTPLRDVELSIGTNNSLKVKTPRLAKAQWMNGHLKQLTNKDGWWQSGDIAKITTTNQIQQLEILGRIDTAIQSGGETVFPEKLETLLFQSAIKDELPIEALLLLPVQDQEWGQRLVALVRLREEHSKTTKSSEAFIRLQSLVKEWLPAERPIAWHKCAQLAPNSTGKWERSYWKDWLAKNNNLYKSSP